MKCPGCNIELDYDPKLDGASMKRLSCNVGACDVLCVTLIVKRK